MRDKEFKKILFKVAIVICVIFFSMISLLNFKDVFKENYSDNIDEKMPLEISILNIGKADCILIKAYDTLMVIDTGTFEDRKYICDYIESLGINKIDYLVLTHNDKDHIGSAGVLINKFEVDQIIQANYKKNTTFYNDYIEAINNKKIKPIKLNEDININIDDVSINIYSALREKYKKSNDYSIIVSVSYSSHSFLFTGDAESERMNEFIKNNTEEYSLLKIPHHGIYSKGLDEFIRSINPKYAVITCSKFKYPHREVLNLLNKYNTKVFFTCNGDLIIKCNGENIYFNQK